MQYGSFRLRSGSVKPIIGILQPDFSMMVVCRKSGSCTRIKG